MTGSMAAKIICIPNRKKLMMKLMWLRLENIMKSKVMKKTKELTSKKIKNVKYIRKNHYQAHYKVSHIIMEIFYYNKIVKLIKIEF